jgi:nitrite reductase/ring-hydroxylating ferredoxin subunit
MLDAMRIDGLTQVATYRRSVAASEERVWENVHDWAHLPWLHSGSFRGIELVDSGDWGWRVNLDLPGDRQPNLLELVIDASRSRYVARTLEGVGKGTEIWTTVTPVDAAKTEIEVEFHLPGVTPKSADKLGEMFTTLYTRLWDEDEQMMRLRSERLRKPAAASEPLPLGSEAEVRERVPLDVEFAGRPVRVDAVDGALRVYSTVCPHWLGPLQAAQADGELICPWHGYRFDVRSGRSCDGNRLRLLPAPRLEIDPVTSQVTLTSVA